MPTDFFDALSQVVSPRFLIPRDAQNRLILAEEQNQGQAGRGEIVYLRKKGKVFAFSLDQQNVDVFPFFNNTTGGIKKRNDAILFCQNGTELYVFIVELKSGYLSEGAVKQLQAGRNFVQYLLNTIDLHWNLSPALQYRYVIFNTSSRTLSKRPTRRSEKVPEIYRGIEVYLEKCNQVHALEEFF